MDRMILSGNEAVALGADQAGVKVATAYPGTPSTEILETVAAWTKIDAQWSPNEKVALEVGMGASFCGARVLVAMKHVGLNVAADPLFTLSYTGVKGGLVIACADDPGMHSSQNEQDNRNYAAFAKVPMLEPTNSQEARDFTIRALEISEQFDTPVILRMTTRVCHGKSVVNIYPVEFPEREYRFEKDPKKYVMVPAFARLRHVEVLKRLEKLRRFADEFEGNRVEMRDTKVGVITSGVTYQYVREAMPTASCLKLGMVYPLPERTIREFASKVDKLVVVEELDPFFEEKIRSMGIEVSGKEEVYQLGELNPERTRSILTGEPEPEVPQVRPRPPRLCAGCPHRGIFAVLNKLKVFVTGDIGCYTLGVLQPLGGMDTCVCMGASIGHCFGFEKALSNNNGARTVAVIGDSTFFHSGVTGLMDMVYNGSHGTILILDNRITAMTGGQEHPGTGKNIRGEESPEIDMEGLCRSLGVTDVRLTDPWNMDDMSNQLEAALEHKGPSVVINRGPCVLMERKPVLPKQVDQEICRECGLCVKTGCPAISEEDGKVSIDPLQCRACGICVQICPFDAISEAPEVAGR